MSSIFVVRLGTRLALRGNNALETPEIRPDHGFIRKNKVCSFDPYSSASASPVSSNTLDIKVNTSLPSFVLSYPALPSLVLPLYTILSLQSVRVSVSEG